MNRSLFVFSFVFSLLAASISAPAFAIENGVFSGRVLDVSGRPVTGAEIFIYSSHDTRRPPDYLSGLTNPAGEFRLTLPEGDYWAVARIRQGHERFGPLMPGDRHSGYPLEIKIAAGENPRDDFVVADLRETARLMRKMDATYFAVQGVLLGKNGQPLQHAYAYAHRDEVITGVPDFLSTWTDGSGSYVLFLPAGEYSFGLASEFPPGLDSLPHIRVRIDNDTKDFDMRSVGSSSRPQSKGEDLPEQP